MYLLKEQNTYYVPALIAHKVQNLSHFYNNREEVRLIIAKHYNYKIANLQKTHVIPSEITDGYIEQLIKKNRNEL